MSQLTLHDHRQDLILVFELLRLVSFVSFVHATLPRICYDKEALLLF